MSNQDVRIEVLSDLFSDVGITATLDQIKEVEKNFSFHLEMESEMSSYQHSGRKEECSTCKRLEHENAELKKEIDIFRNSVKQRRHAERVWTDGDRVMYE